MNVGNLSEWVFGIITLVVGWVAHAVTSAFKAGREIGKYATKDDLDYYLPRHEFESFREDTKGDFAAIEKRLGDMEGRIINAILETRK